MLASNWYQLCHCQRIDRPSVPTFDLDASENLCFWLKFMRFIWWLNVKHGLREAIPHQKGRWYYAIGPECHNTHLPLPDTSPQARFPETRPVCRLLPWFVLLTQHLLLLLPPDCTWALNVQKLPPAVVAAKSAHSCSVKPSLSRTLLLGPAL